MIKSLQCGREAAYRVSEIWMVIGRRLHARRCELGIDAARLAREIGITPEAYGGYEEGLAETPAQLLEQIAGLLGVPVPWFFQDVGFGDEDEDPLPLYPDGPGIFAVATEDQRVEVLADCFRRLDFDDQQHLLAIAEALAEARQ